jgi:hypothetical protein
MLIYNVTIKISNNIHSAWLAWMKNEHIPEVLATGCFSKATLVKLLEVDDSEGPTYAAQYLADTREQYDAYLNTHAAILRQKSFEKWGNEFIAFRSLMQVIH